MMIALPMGLRLKPKVQIEISTTLPSEDGGTEQKCKNQDVAGHSQK